MPRDTPPTTANNTQNRTASPSSLLLDAIASKAPLEYPNNSEKSLALENGPVAGNRRLSPSQTVGSSSSSSLRSSRTHSRRRVFSLFGNYFFQSNSAATMPATTFQFSQTRLWDAVVDWGSWIVEGIIYLIGPVLIMLALGIISLLTYAFGTILLPMLKEKYIGNVPIASSSNYFGIFIVGLHCLFVAFVVTNILFNYACCVFTKHNGPLYHQIVREMAKATNFEYPETPQAVAIYRREYEDKMMLRMQRRRQRHEQQQQQQESSDNGPSPTNVTHRTRGGQSQPPATSTTSAPSQSVRRWMLMGPFEWGYCGHSNTPKPPRSHYDHVTKQLVLNLDHYCPWMFNAIGYLNYRYFVNFLVYVFLGMCYGALVSLEPFLLLSSKDYKNQWKKEQALSKSPNFHPPIERLRPMLPFREERMLLTLSFMLCAAVGVAVLMLGGFHIYLTLTAQTTIEFHGNWHNKRKAKSVGQKWQNPYSKGSYLRNWQQVYGSQYPVWRAILPSRREPDALPAPVPGHPGRRALAAQNKHEREERNPMLNDIENGKENGIV